MTCTNIITETDGATLKLTKLHLRNENMLINDKKVRNIWFDCMVDANTMIFLHAEMYM